MTFACTKLCSRPERSCGTPSSLARLDCGDISYRLDMTDLFSSGKTHFVRKQHILESRFRDRNTCRICWVKRHLAINRYLGDHFPARPKTISFQADSRNLQASRAPKVCNMNRESPYVHGDAGSIYCIHQSSANQRCRRQSDLFPYRATT